MRRLQACMDFSMWSSTLPKDSRSQPVSQPKTASFFLFVLFNHTYAHALAQRPLTHSCCAYSICVCQLNTYSFYCAMIQQRDGQTNWCRMRAMREREPQKNWRQIKKKKLGTSKIKHRELLVKIILAAYLIQMFLCIAVWAGAAVFFVFFYHQSSVILAGSC